MNLCPEYEPTPCAIWPTVGIYSFYNLKQEKEQHNFTAGSGVQDNTLMKEK